MSARVHQLLDEIREKSVQWKQQVVAERAKKATLNAEIARLKDQMSRKEQEVENLQGKVTELAGTIESLKEQSVNSIPQTEVKLSNEEIDALVKEIEYCIGQLKR